MKPSQLALFLTAAFKRRRPVLIKGAPGIGKSDIITQATAAANANLIISHPAVSDPTDAKGLPWPDADKKSARFLPFGDLAIALKAKKLTVWLLEELGQAPPAVQASYMHLLLAREVNGHKLPDCVTFVATTNRRTDLAGVSGILEPVKSRFLSIVELQTDLNEWCQWYFTERPDSTPIVPAFLRFREELLCKFEPTKDLDNSPVPRTWVNAAEIIDMDLPPAVRNEALIGAIGQSAAVEIQGFMNILTEAPSINAILMDPDATAIPTRPDVLYAIVTGLAIKANEENFGSVARYVERLVENDHGEFGALLLRDVLRRNPELQNSPEAVHVFSGELGQLITSSVEH